MHEVLPIAFGAIAGLLVLPIRRTGLRVAALVVLCLILGALASFINGETMSSLALAFVSFDTVLVFVGAVLTVTAAALWRRRAATR